MFKENFIFSVNRWRLTEDQQASGRHFYCIIATITYVTLGTTSMNRINWVISFQQLGSSHIVMGEYRYDSIISLPNTTHQHYPEMIPASNSNSTNTSDNRAGTSHSHAKDEPHAIDCTSAFAAVQRTLQATNRQVHQEVNKLIADIRNELPKKIIRQNRKSRAWLNIGGSILKTFFGTMSQKDSAIINDRLKILERYTEESSQRTKLDVSRLVTGELILQSRMSDMLNELRHNTMILTRAIDHRTDSLEQEPEWSNALLSKAL